MSQRNTFTASPFVVSAALALGLGWLPPQPASAQTGRPATAGDIDDLAPLMPRPADAGDEDLAAIAPPLVLALAAERLRLHPAVAIAAAGQRLEFRLSLPAPASSQRGPQKFIVEQWRVDGLAPGNSVVGAIGGLTLPGPTSEAVATYVAPPRIDATREVSVSATVRFGEQAHNRVEVLARVLLVAGPIAASVTWDTRAAHVMPRRDARGAAPAIDTESSVSATHHHARGAAVFSAAAPAGQAFAGGKRVELWASEGFAHAEASFLMRSQRVKENAWCHERSSTIQAAQGKAVARYAPGSASAPPRLVLELVAGQMRARFSPPTLRVQARLEDASRYSRRCRPGTSQGHDDVNQTEMRDWTHGATHVGLQAASAALQRTGDGSWLWEGTVHDPVNNDEFQQSTRYRVTLRMQ